MIVAGLMSGTSLDGVDVALVGISGKGWKARVEAIAGSSTPYPKKLREMILAISNRECHTGEIARMNFYLGEFYTDCLTALSKKSHVLPELVGSHGQTIFHEGQGRKMFGVQVRSTLQIGEPSVIAEALGVPVVSDFRVRDMAAGGRGAPLAPYADYLLFRDAKQNRVAVNIGGIGNLTWLPKNAAPEDVVAFDTGPGNMIVDQLVAHFSKGRRNYDAGGAWAAKGQVDEALLKAWTRDRYYRETPPKTAGREEYGAAFVERALAAKLSAEDLIATATAFTARTIRMGIELVSKGEPVDLILVSGGGVHNKTLMSMLANEMPRTTVANSALAGVDPDMKEATFFALIAYETWHQRPGNLPAATGARHPVILGKVTR